MINNLNSNDHISYRIDYNWKRNIQKCGLFLWNKYSIYITKHRLSHNVFYMSCETVKEKNLALQLYLLFYCTRNY